ncbi:MAG: aminoacetone oxidase family FAD-binding enzyme, partial [Clostridia bacterium]|nr:aminoacetone oxidase family FAD-binding enzyme [Clostridia bacterium]
MENESRRRVAVCGGGAAGLLCAYFSAKNGDDVTVFEKNHAPARKLAITGKGRCNVTNDSEFQEILQNIPRNPKFLYAALRAFSPEDTKSLFESFGVALKTERGNRVFPVSDNAYDIVDALVGACKKEKVKILCDTPISHLWLENGSLCGVKAASKQIPFDKVVIATGGKSYPLTGSTGDGYLLAKEAGHTIIPPSPALIPIETEESWPKAAMGLSLKNTALEVTDIKSGKKIFGDFGEMLFTHFGISGPMVLSASSYIDFSDCKRYKISIDLKPALDENTLEMR